MFPGLRSPPSTPHVRDPGPVARVREAGAVMVGCSVSATITYCVAPAVLPLASVASHVIVVVPWGKGSVSAAPSPRVPTRLAMAQLSAAEAPGDATVA